MEAICCGVRHKDAKQGTTAESRAAPDAVFLIVVVVVFEPHVERGLCAASEPGLAGQTPHAGRLPLLPSFNPVVVITRARVSVSARTVRD